MQKNIYFARLFSLSLAEPRFQFLYNEIRTRTAQLGWLKTLRLRFKYRKGSEKFHK